MPPVNGVKVQLGGKARRLRYTTLALMLLEEEVGQTYVEVLTASDTGSIKAIVALVWAGLLHAEPKITRQEVAEMVDLQKIREIAEAIGQATRIALVRDADKEPDEGNAQPAA